MFNSIVRIHYGGQTAEPMFKTNKRNRIKKKKNRNHQQNYSCIYSRRNILVILNVFYDGSLNNNIFQAYIIFI